jgi:hypothetical protein
MWSGHSWQSQTPGLLIKSSNLCFHCRFYLADLLMIPHVILFSALMVQLEALQLAVDGAASALNTWHDTPVAHLQDIPVHVRDVALHDVCHGAAVALAIAQVRSGLDLRSVEPSFPEGPRQLP